MKTAVLRSSILFKKQVSSTPRKGPGKLFNTTTVKELQNAGLSCDTNSEVSHNLQQKVDLYCNCLKTIAWKQSHLLRSPLANLKGLMPLLRQDPSDTNILRMMGEELLKLDDIVIKMVREVSLTTKILSRKNL